MSFGRIGNELWKRIGVEPSGNAFNSIFQLEMEKGIPRNPLINAGALVMADVLLSVLEYPEREYLSLCGNSAAMTRFNIMKAWLLPNGSMDI